MWPPEKNKILYSTVLHIDTIIDYAVLNWLSILHTNVCNYIKCIKQNIAHYNE